MPQSKLEIYEDIICTLAEGALPIDNLAFECNLNCILLQERLEFLAKHNIVTIEISQDNRAFYVLTSRGLAISKTFAVTKRLKKLQTTPQASAKALQVTSAFSEESGEKIRRVW